MRVLITGARGFIGKNLVIRLGEITGYEVSQFVRGDSLELLQNQVRGADAIFHLAGVNRPVDPSEFFIGNSRLTEVLCEFIAEVHSNTGRFIPLVVASSIQAELANPYGESKRSAELAAENLANLTGNPVTIFRLPNVFGKWCQPNYNSVVATFCHNVANDLPIQINDPKVRLQLVYIDDVVNRFIEILSDLGDGIQWGTVEPVHEIELGALAAQIESFRGGRVSLLSERVGVGFVRALYATYVSYLPPAKFSYPLPRYGDERGVFVEMLKTKDSGQFSFFTAHPGVTRGGHYHHSKTEKFLVVKGIARFGFRHVLTNEHHEVLADGKHPEVVETVPGWIHDITNVGDDELIVMLWANEIFDLEHPDTIACKV